MLLNRANKQLQGLSNLDQQINVGNIYIHTKSTISLFFMCNLAQKNSTAASCGISNLQVVIDQVNSLISQNVDIICPSQSKYFSYFTNNCENCLTNGCQLYPDYVPVLYIKCSIGCLDCSSSTVCILCDIDSGYQLLLDGSICICQTGYVQQTTCNKCHYSCLECTGTSDTHCTSCESTRTLVGGVCQCLDGRVDVFSQTKCSPIHYSSENYCHYSCETCLYTEYYHCLTCPTGSNRAFKNWNSCPCIAQFNDAGYTTCDIMICDSTCQACDGPLSSDCLSCPKNFIFELGYCMCDGLFNNIASSQICVENSNQCDLSCLTCFNETPQGCLSCDPSQIRSLNVNYTTSEYQCTCFDGYFGDTENCQQCDQICLTCSSLQICTSCNIEQNRQLSNTNQCVCITGFNDRLNPGQSCVQDLTNCHFSCTKCFGQLSNQCLECNSTYRVLNNTTCDCLASQYDTGMLQCQSCHQNCLTCNGSQTNNCLTCNTSLNRQLQLNQCNCITGYNDKLNTDSCEEDLHICYQTCLTCYGLGQNQCLSCQSDRASQGDQCICNSIYYEQQSICQLCDQTCLTCSNSGPNNCIDCDGQNLRYKNNNKCNCMSGYVDIGTAKCQVCPNDCNDCDSDLKCTSCNIDKSLVNSFGRCDCIDGYLLQNLQCLNCHHSCQKCNGLLKSQCTQCDPIQFRRLSFTVCQCQDGYQENDYGQCVDCQSNEGKEIFSCQYKNAQDGVWTYGEQCDDGNNDSRDGFALINQINLQFVINVQITVQNVNNINIKIKQYASIVTYNTITLNLNAQYVMRILVYSALSPVIVQCVGIRKFQFQESATIAKMVIIMRRISENLSVVMEQKLVRKNVMMEIHNQVMDALRSAKQKIILYVKPLITILIVLLMNNLIQHMKSYNLVICKRGFQYGYLKMQLIEMFIQTQLTNRIFRNIMLFLEIIHF